MKRCHECGREYDNTMMFCLDDGAELLYGPAKSEPGALATGFQANEPQTAILHSTAAPGEAPTRAQIPTKEQTAILRTGAEAEPEKNFGASSQRKSGSANKAAGPQNRRNKLLLICSITILLVVAGLFGYKYLAPTKQIESIAVMPFVNAGGNDDVEYLSDGMTESLINSLTQLPDLKVIARSSVFSYKGKATDPFVVGKELGVRAVLSGRIVQHGDTLAISTELIDVRENRQLWGEQYERKLSDVLALQRDIATEIVSQLRLKLSGAEQTLVTKHYTDSPEAYQLYLKGRFFWLKFTPADHLRAAEFFNQAIAKDPNYAQAYAGLADTYLASAGNGWMAPSDAYPKAKAAVEKALALDDTLPDSHLSSGVIKYFYDLNWAAAEREFKRGIELNPNFPGSYEIYSQLLCATGRLDEAVATAKHGLDLDPLSGQINDDLSFAYYFLRRYDESIKQWQKSLEIDPNDTFALLGIGSAYEQKGMYDEAIAVYQKAINASERTSLFLAPLGHAYASSGRKGEALKILAELNERSKQKYVSPYDLSVLYTGLGEKDKAMEQLNKAYQDRGSASFLFIKVEPIFDPLRSNPRFTDLLRKMGLPE